MIKVKEIWIRFDNQEKYIENKERLFLLLDKAPGNSLVRVYDANTRGHERLKGHSFDETQLFLLTDVFGEDNVRIQEKEVKIERYEQFKAPVVKQIIPCIHDMYAIVKDLTGIKHRYKVLMYALCGNGEVYPLFFDDLRGVCLLHDTILDVDRYELD